MTDFRTEKVVCPVCGASGTCSSHASYGRNLIDFISGVPVYHKIKVTRVICSNCNHTHAILPDFIIPYSTYGLFFILRVIAEYLLQRLSVEKLCQRFGISHSMLYRWLKLFQTHKDLWLGLLTSAEISSLRFLNDICFQEYSVFASDFTRLSTVSFLQSHQNPAPYCQTVF